MNAQYLRHRFAAHLGEPGDRTVLDIGCGVGHVLEILRERGFVATGVELDAIAAAQARARGFDVHDAPAERLPFADATFDHVTMRHVPHHLPDPSAGISEAIRVARHSTLLAEPWFDESLPCQALALELDRWVKGHHRRLGRTHGENHSAAELLAMVPDVEAFDVEIEHCLRLRPRPFAEFKAEAHKAIGGLEDPVEAARCEELLARIRERGASYNGSVIVHLTRRQA